MNRKQTWECVPCRRTIQVIHHTAAPQPTERQCVCGRAMGLVLFSTKEAPRSENEAAKVKA